MATNVTTDRVVNGSYGELWIDGVKMAEVYGLDAQMEVLKSEVPMCGVNSGVGKKYTGWNGTGSLRFNKVSSTFSKRQAEAIKAGVPLVSTIISKLADPSVAKYGHERLELRGVQFDTISLAQWEAGSLIQHEVPFTFEDFNFLNAIAD